MLAPIFSIPCCILSNRERPYFLDGIEPLAGFSHLLASFRPFLDPVLLLPGIFGLFLIGLVLSYALIRTGKLYLGIGLHAGWVFSLKTMRVFGDLPVTI
jgi:membrane protease YdiL (CAAX protease family)